MRARVISEEDIRRMDFQFVSTEVVEGGEIDTLRSEDPADQIEIRVHLEGRRIGMAPEIMVFAGLSLLSTLPDKLPLRIIGEDGRALDRELTEVIAWEKVEDDFDLCEAYSLGRSAARGENGQRAPVGTRIEHVAPEAITPVDEPVRDDGVELDI